MFPRILPPGNFRGVMFVVAEAPTLREAQQKAMEDVKRIECDNLFHRTDIGAKAFR